ncbi:MAG: hypothetical protein HY854_17375 [Burkholderiales bacterium]|nr:hypothetical protein [Burkholderiales bacterium]
MKSLGLPDDFVALVAKGISVIVASRDAGLRPSVMRAVGCKLGPAEGEVTVYLSRPQSRQLLLDLAAGGGIAVVFSHPRTHRTFQLKSRRVSLRNAGPEDEPELERYALSMEDEISAVGFTRELARAMLVHGADEVVAVSFRPELAFDQTPGPRAGTAVERP